MHQVAQHLYNAVESSEVCLRLYLMALQAADDTGLEGLAYEFAVQVGFWLQASADGRYAHIDKQCFVIYEESINDSKAQLQAITLIINTLHETRVFSEENYDTLITKAALHGAKLLKKGHQATAVAKASHLWWQSEIPSRPQGAKVRTCKQRRNMIIDLDTCSHWCETASGFSNACKSLCALPLHVSMNSPPCSSTSMR